MLCFRDTTFCKSDCSNDQCPRHWDEQKAEAARKWWGSDEAPVAFSDFSRWCVDYEVKDGR